MKGEAALTSEELAWRLVWDESGPRSVSFEDRRSGRTFRLDEASELGLLFSTAPDQVAQPLVHVSAFELRGEPQVQGDTALFVLHHPALQFEVRLHYQLEGPTRRKWVEVENQSGADLLLLDVELDDFAIEAELSGGGWGEPVFLGASAFAALEHPAGLNQGEAGRVRLKHFPGRRLGPGAQMCSHTALVSVAEPGQAREHFINYIQQRCRRRPAALSVYTPFGINNQWGACPTLDDEQTLEVLKLLGQWQKKGVSFDYFTLDTGWSDPSSDLTRFRPVAYPNGPRAVVEKVAALGMKFGLWFATSWGTQSCWEYEPAYAGQPLPGLPYKEGYAQTLGGITFCLGEEGYYQLLKKAILHHIRFHLDEGDVAFLARIGALAKKHQTLFLQRRTFLGDPWKSQIYGYAHCQGRRGFLFINNPHFAARQASFRLGPGLGLDAQPGAPFQLRSHFPAQEHLLRDGDVPYKYGEVVELWLRPFEVLMLELKPWVNRPAALPRRAIGEAQVAELGRALDLQPIPLPERLQLRFADAALFAGRGHRKRRCAFATPLPSLEGMQPVLAVVVRLRQGEAEWRYSPAVVEITQLVGRIGEQSLIFVPTPDSRQYGNTQKAGCSWVVFKTRLSPQWSGQTLELALHSWLPPEVEAQVEAWIVRQWWPTEARPTGDGYYTYAPS